VGSSSIGLGRITTGAAFLAVGAMWAAASLGADAGDKNTSAFCAVSLSATTEVTLIVPSSQSK
jgi:hypothetical protein